MTEYPTALQLCINTLHATASASPEAELVVHECFEELRVMGIDVSHSEENKPRKTWVQSVTTKAQQTLC